MNLDTTIDLNLKAFFQWWARELAFLLPQRLRCLFRDRQGRLIVSSVEDGFVLRWQADDDSLSAIDSTLSVSDIQRYQCLREQYPTFDKAERILQLSAGQALYRLIYLPVAAQENVRQVVRYELDRYTPFNDDQIYFTAEVLDKTEVGQLRVLLILTPKILLDPLLAQLDGLGFRAHRIVYSGLPAELEAHSQHNLLPETYRDSGDQWSQALHWSLNLLMLGLLMAVMIVPVWRQSEAVERVKQAIKALDKQTQRVEAQQHEIDALRSETQILIDVKRQAPALSAVLNELTQRLNDDTWLTHFQYTDNHLQIQGQSPVASTLIGVLEDSAFFSNVSFVSPLTQDKTTGRERFQISMDVIMPQDLNGGEGEELTGNDGTAVTDQGEASSTDDGVAISEPNADSEGGSGE